MPELALMVFATLGMGVLCGPSTFGTTTSHKGSGGSDAKNSSRAKSVASSKKTKAPTGKSSGAAKSAGSGKAGAGKVGVSKSGKRGGKKPTSGRQRGQTAPTPERITEIQQALAKNGALSGEPSGKWDEPTADAMRKFQAAHGLNANGKLDAPTLNVLGLGAATAGMARPTPAVKSSSATLPADIQQ